MTSVLTDDFRACFAALPAEVREQARQAYRRWRDNPAHPGLRYKPVRGHPEVWSVRVGRGWRALGRVDGGTIAWFWIGSHADYIGLIG